MTDALNRAGIHNYTIWNKGDDLIGYYECESVKRALQIREGIPVVNWWRALMSNLMVMVASTEHEESTGFKQVFFHE